MPQNDISPSKLIDILKKASEILREPLEDVTEKIASFVDSRGGMQAKPFAMLVERNASAKVLDSSENPIRYVSIKIEDRVPFTISRQSARVLDKETKQMVDTYRLFISNSNLSDPQCGGKPESYQFERRGFRRQIDRMDYSKCRRRLN